MQLSRSIEEYKKLLKAFRRDMSDWLFHFTKTPKALERCEYDHLGIPNELDLDDFSKICQSKHFRINPEDKRIFMSAYERSSDNTYLMLRKIEMDVAHDLNRICGQVGCKIYFPWVNKPSTACDVLRKILYQRKLRGGVGGGIKGGSQCICFSEAPISELSMIFAIAHDSHDTDVLPKYAPYGIAVRKE